MRHLSILLAIFLSGITLYCAGCLSLGKSQAIIAEELRKEGKFKEAIEHYETHIENRIADSKRSAEENPHFYYLLIGDIYLEIDQFDDARGAYDTARENIILKETNIEETPLALLVLDRYRTLGSYLEKQEKLQEAIDLLKEYRDLDPAKFDHDIDRIHKKMVKKEQEA